ncbi:MAG: glutamate--tRNA ligase [Patescibacteria group bacterium]
MHFNIFGVRLDDLTAQDLEEKFEQWLLGSEQKIIVTPNAEFLLRARKDELFTDTLCASDLSLPDGISMVYAVLALTDEKLHNRHTGVDAVYHLAELCHKNAKRLLLFGGNPGSAEQSALTLQNIYPGLDVVHLDPGHVAVDGEGEPQISAEVLRKIDEFQPDVIAAALGVKKQELFCTQYLNHFPSIKIAIGVGGSFETIAGVLPRAPYWMRSAGLEWLWRLKLQPKSRSKRIFKAIIVFPLLVACETVKKWRFKQACLNVFPVVIEQLNLKRSNRAKRAKTVVKSASSTSQNKSMKIRTRIAPSPTGYVHIGTLHTALFNYLLAKQSDGDFIIRIEDTDRERLVEGATENLLGVFLQLGLKHDEGPYVDENGVLDEKGAYGPYTQSQRLETYRKYINQLVAEDHAYACFCTKERLDEMRQAQQATKQSPRYDGSCRRLSAEERKAKIDSGKPYVIRLKVPEGGSVEFDDLIRGKIVIKTSEVDDQVILKSDGYPTYHLAVVVDDYLMQITHIVRGEEWLSSTPKHVLLYQYLGFDLPTFAHLPLLLNPDKTKLSKRQGDVAVEDYLKRGYLPAALINFVGTLGFNPKSDEEIYSLNELIKLFDLTKVNKSGAVLNMDKLDWMNNHYIRQLSEADLAEAARSFVQADVDNEFVRRVLVIERERVNRLDELQDRIELYLEEPSYDPSVLIWKKADKQDALEQLTNIRNVISEMNDQAFEKSESIEKQIKEYIEKNELQNGNVLWPLRVALSGKEKSASPFELLWALKKEKSLTRLDRALKILL